MTCKINADTTDGLKIVSDTSGEIEIQVDLKKNIDELMRCNCSMCKRKGTMYTIIKKNNLKILKGESKIKTYQFNTKVAKHHFCSECGTHTHNLRRSDPNTYGINMGCIDEIKPNELFTFKIHLRDGQNHIKDRK